jgi:sulfur relay (sulfurtransferase) complex TusBCD TusD component (DsrE family)
MLSTTRRLSAVCLLAIAIALPVMPASAGDHDPLFINLTTDDGHRVNMAFNFGGNQLKRGHELTIFMNDKAVLAASALNAEKFKEQQATIQSLLDAGATILVCPMCMKHYGVAESDLLPGLKVGNPELTGAALFKDDTKTMTW